ncbi:GNAT acetyltransferase [Gracilibacillus orientalis]|uniref:GNAT acetyltransferase n=1 Tax=Gracilibacillus orientalis TaxID=334253 RepID=A0A1I4LKD3_9BACI|nr:GNAT family N-acetyltransferase [Gracilibacillus orientalis]SFL91432.1 GNAT acetyltransferase [Gracilibacillus orientalis]
MFLLPRSQYFKVKPLFKSFHHQIIIHSVLEGNTSGDIFVDDINDPKSVVLYGINFEVLVAGETQNKEFNKKLYQLIINEFLPNIRKKGLPIINLYYDSEQWKQVLELEIIDQIESTTVNKRFYTLDETKGFQSQKPLQDNAAIKPVNEQLLRDSSLKNLDLVTQWIHVAWPSVDHFLNKGIGYCVVESDTIASWCLSLFATNNQCELGLMTDEAYRKKGYAKAVALACVNFCVDHNKKPVWNCDDENTGSILVAESVRLQKVLNYNVFQLKA